MRYLICVDDTDDLTKATSTGKIANLIAKKLEKEFNIKINKGVTRHQLLLQEGVPYTSHNSAMCIDVSGEVTMEKIKKESIKIVLDNMAQSSDPGICVCLVDELKEQKDLINFGIKAQNKIIQKDEALSLIKNISCIFGEELGGTGQGIIGALAGIGLRLSGNDGTFRGKIKFPKSINEMTVKELKEKFRVDDVIDLENEFILNDEIILENESFAKLLFRKNKKLAFATKINEEKYLLCNKEQAMNVDSNKYTLGEKNYCEHFVLDNDVNECLTINNSCLNCLYRRLTQDGFTCTYNK